MPRLYLALVASAIVASSLAGSAQGNNTQEIVARAASYVADFVNRFSNLVAEEHYVQDTRTVGRPSSKGSPKGSSKGPVLQGLTRHRELKSDFLLVLIQGLNELGAFRDVFDVDGRPVRDRQERLTRLFIEPSATAVEQATAIAREGVRYNIGDGTRTINNPVLALAFLQSRYHPRFRFSVREVDKEVGPDVWIVEYKEQTRPTMLRLKPSGASSEPDRDLVATGRFWIERGTGRVMKTELAIGDSDEIVTSFRFDDRFQIALPDEMRESYFFDGEYVTGVARYSGFRQFAVHTETAIK
jgi:hypothetical protein